MVRSSGPRTASTMQNSEAPRAAVSRAAARTSSVSRKGVALTGRVEARGLRAEVAVLGAAAGLGGQDALDLDLGPAPGQPDLVGQGGQRHDGAVGQRGQRGELVRRQEATLVEEGGLCAGDHSSVRRTQGDLGRRRRRRSGSGAERKATGLVVVTAPTVVAGCGPPEVGRRAGRSGHGLGFLDRTRVRGEAGVDARLRARGGVPARDARSDVRPGAGADPAAAGAGQGGGAVGGAPAAGAGWHGLRAGAAGADARDPGAVAAGAGGVRQQCAGLGERGVAGGGYRGVGERGAAGAVVAAVAGWGAAVGLLDDRARHGWIRSDAVADVGGAGRRGVGDQRAQVVHIQRVRGGLPDRDGGDQSRRAPVLGVVDDHRAGRHAGRRHRAGRLDHGGPAHAVRALREPRRDHLHRRAGAGRAT